MRLSLWLLLAALLTAGCPSGSEDLPVLTFEPATDDRGAGSVDLGTVAVGTNPPPNFTIIATNNSEDEVEVGVNCNTLAGTPFGTISCPTDRVTIPAAGSTDPAGTPNNTLAIGGNLLVGPNDVGDHSASLLFDSENVIYSFTLRVTVTN